MEKTVFEAFQNKGHRVRYISDFKDMLGQSADIYKRRTAFRLKNPDGHIFEVTYGDFYSDYRDLCVNLLNKGYSGDKKIAVIGKNSYSWALSYLAAATVCVAVPIDKELHEEEIINFINAAKCDMVIADKPCLDKLFAVGERFFCDRIEFIINGMTAQDDLSCVGDLLSQGALCSDSDGAQFDSLKIDPDEAKILLFTSGTTGNAKGVCLSHRNICSNMMSVAGMVKVRPSDSVLSILPIHHTYECTLGFLLILYLGASIAYAESLRQITKNIQEFRPTIMVTVPLFLEKVYYKVVDAVMNKLPAGEKEKMKGLSFEQGFAKLSPFIRAVVKKKAKYSFGGKLHTFIVGAAAVDPFVIEGFGNLGLRVLQGYGLTECSPLLTGNNDFFMKPDSIGLAIHGVHVKIDSPDDTGVGEIIAKGDNIMLGYYNDEAATKAVIKDGWFYTGDLGYQDENGWFYITGRKKNVIVTKNGKNIYPEELEEHLNASVFIAESLILGSVSKFDGSPCVKAKILPDVSAIGRTLGTEQPDTRQIAEVIKEVVTEVNEKLPAYKRIRTFSIRNKEFEKTTTKKIKRHGENINEDEDDLTGEE